MVINESQFNVNSSSNIDTIHWPRFDADFDEMKNVTSNQYSPRIIEQNNKIASNNSVVDVILSNNFQTNCEADGTPPPKVCFFSIFYSSEHEKR